MEGNPADLTIYADWSRTNDHTYYGNGCPNDWGADGEGGSKTPCATRIVQTSDSENQKIGTYYHMQAASSGSGYDWQTEGSPFPDTFCPLGWQLPYDGTGGDYYNKSRLWQYLVNTYSITADPTGANKLMSYPFSYILSGHFWFEPGLLYRQGNRGLYWSSIRADGSNTKILHIRDSHYDFGQLTSPFGLPVRCIFDFSKAKIKS